MDCLKSAALLAFSGQLAQHAEAERTLGTRQLGGVLMAEEQQSMDFHVRRKQTNSGADNKGDKFAHAADDDQASQFHADLRAQILGHNISSLDGLVDDLEADDKAVCSNKMNQPMSMHPPEKHRLTDQEVHASLVALATHISNVLLGNSSTSRLAGDERKTIEWVHSKAKPAISEQVIPVARRKELSPPIAAGIEMLKTENETPEKMNELVNKFLKSVQNMTLGNQTGHVHRLEFQPEFVPVLANGRRLQPMKSFQFSTDTVTTESVMKIYNAIVQVLSDATEYHDYQGACLKCWFSKELRKATQGQSFGGKFATALLGTEEAGGKKLDDGGFRNSVTQAIEKLLGISLANRLFHGHFLADKGMGMFLSFTSASKEVPGTEYETSKEKQDQREFWNLIGDVSDQQKPVRAAEVMLELARQIENTVNYNEQLDLIDKFSNRAPIAASLILQGPLKANVAALIASAADYVVQNRRAVTVKEVHKSATASTFKVGQVVERRDKDTPWGRGVVTSLSPLKVSTSTRNKQDGHKWDEVRAIQATSVIELDSDNLMLAPDQLKMLDCNYSMTRITQGALLQLTRSKNSDIRPRKNWYDHCDCDECCSSCGQLCTSTGGCHGCEKCCDPKCCEVCCAILCCCCQ
jgi:hypothetical protein